MFCDVCKTEMKETKTTLEVNGKETMVNVENVPCYTCEKCGARVIDGITIELVKKSVKKCKDARMDFNELKGLGLMIGKVTM